MLPQSQTDQKYKMIHLKSEPHTNFQMVPDTADLEARSMFILPRETAEYAAGAGRESELYHHLQLQHRFKFAEAYCKTTALLC